MADFSVKITGLEDLEKKLLELPARLARQVVRPALEEGGEIIRQEMGIIAPRRTGRLGSSKGIGMKVELSTKYDQGKVSVGPTKEAFYGDILQKGWRSRGNPKKRSTRGMGAVHSAHPFIDVALKNKWRQALDAIASVMRLGLKEVTR